MASHAHCSKVQDAYSMRCMPQVHGSLRGALAQVECVLACELNAATDESTRRRKGWPATAHTLSGLVRRIGPALRRLGVDVRKEKTGHDCPDDPFEQMMRAVGAVFERDYPVIMGVNLMVATVVISANLVTDLAYCLIDPRISYR